MQLLWKVAAVTAFGAFGNDPSRMRNQVGPSKGDFMKWMIIVLSLALAACGTSGQVRSKYSHAPTDRFTYEVVNTGGMSVEGLVILKTRLDTTLSALGRLAVDNDPAAKKIRVEITKYRMRHGANRALFGIMAGKDSIVSNVRVIDAAGNVLGEIEVNSGNASAWGTSRGLIEGHANEIVGFVTGATL